MVVLQAAVQISGRRPHYSVSSSGPCRRGGRGSSPSGGRSRRDTPCRPTRPCQPGRWRRCGPPIVAATAVFGAASSRAARAETVTTSPQAVPSILQFLHSKLSSKTFSNKKITLGHREEKKLKIAQKGSLLIN